VEEQRLLAGTKADDIKQRKVVEDVTTRHHVSVDMSFTKDGTLCVVISGKNRKSVDDAKTLLMNKLQKQAEVEMVGIPLPHYAAIIGRGGEILKNIQQETGTRIKVRLAHRVKRIATVTPCFCAPPSTLVGMRNMENADAFILRQRTVWHHAIWSLWLCASDPYLALLLVCHPPPRHPAHHADGLHLECFRFLRPMILPELSVSRAQLTVAEGPGQ
jgi:hypothetical protein